MDRLKATTLKSRASQTSNLSLSTSNLPSKTSPKSNLNLLQLPKNLLASSLRHSRLHSFLGIACLLRFGLLLRLLRLLLLIGLFLHAPHVRISSHRTSAPFLGRQFNQRSELTGTYLRNSSSLFEPYIESGDMYWVYALSRRVSKARFNPSDEQD